MRVCSALAQVKLHCALLSGIALCGLTAAKSPIQLLQLSDLHFRIGRGHRETWNAKFGDSKADLRLFAETLLPVLSPKAILVTGDLVNAKNAQMRGDQSVLEWQGYREAVEGLKKGAGLPEAAILDVRGNHDTFNVPDRLGSEDFFVAHAAAGRRNGSARVYTYEVRSKDAGQAASCPEAVVVGVDTSKEPGFSGPNFFGVASERLLWEVDAVLTSAKAEARASGCEPMLIAYGHFPLSIITHPETDPWWLFAKKSPRSKEFDITLKQLLLRHGVSAYLNGHLHSAFGTRLHRMHAARAGGPYLAELETSAWLSDRRFRILTIDNGSLAFADLIYVSGKSSQPGRASERMAQNGHSIFAVSTEQQVNGSVVIITSPPSASYSPLLSLSQSTERQVYQELRALIIPVHGRQQHPDMKVDLHWSCQSEMGKQAMQPVHGSEGLWRASLPQAECRSGLIYVQVLLSDGSSSEMQPVAWLCGSGTKRTGSFTTPQQPVPLELSWLDWCRSVALIAEWPYVGYWLMWGSWMLHFFGLLLLPRAVLSLKQSHTSPLRLGKAKTSLSSWTGPLTWLLDMASLPRVWLPQVAASIYLALGPWAVLSFLKAEPAGLGFLGRLLFFHRGRLHFAQNLDTAIIVFLHNMLSLIPLTLLMAAKSSRHAAAENKKMLRSKETSPKLFSVLEVAGLLLWLWIQLKTSVLSFFHGVGIAGDGLWSGTVLAAGMYAALSWQLYASKQAWHASDRLQDTASASGSPKSD